MRKTFYLLALAFAGVGLGISNASAQLNLTWEELGPNNMGNHTRALAVDGSGNVWAGSVGGGLWKSTNEGATWNQVGGFSTLAVSCIAVDGSNIYVGTGENFFYEPSGTLITTWNHDSVTTFRPGFFGYTGQPGEGVFVSTDAGSTWDHDNGTWNSGSTLFSGPFKSIQKIAVSGSRVLVATLEGLYVSDNNLNTVTKATGTTAFQNRPIVDVEFLGNNIVLAATKDSLYRSTNNGTSFGSSINSTIPVGTTPPNNRVGGDRIEIAVAPSDNNVVYVAGASDINGNCTGVFRSDDAGLTWMRIAPYESATFKPFQGQGLYSLVLAVHPNDADAVILGGKSMYKYSPANGWVSTASSTYIPGFSTNYVPSPQLSIAVDPSSDSTIYVGTDGEIMRSANFGRTFTFRTKGFNTAHLYGVDGSPSWEILASDRYRGILYKDNGNPDASLQQFDDIYSLTKGVARWSIFKPDHIIAQGPDGGLQRSFNKGASFEYFYALPLLPIHPSFGVNPDSIYVDRADTTSSGGVLYDGGTPPLSVWCQDEYLPTASLSNDTAILNTPLYVYLAARNFVWVCRNPFGDLDSLPTWNRLTNDLTGNLSGGKREFFTAMACSNDADHVLWVGTNDGKIVRIFNANDPVNLDLNTKVVRIDTGEGMPRRWITDIAVDPSDANNIMVTFGGYAAGDDRVYISNDAKAANPTFRSIHANLPDNMPVYTAAFHPAASSTVTLIGTENGIYGSNTNYTNPAANFTWSNESGAVGNVAVYDIMIRRYFIDWIDNNDYKFAPDYTIFAATHGRGAFKTRSLVATEDPHFVASGIHMDLSPNPTVAGSNVAIELPSATHVKVEAFDINGNRVAQLVDRQYGAGRVEIQFDTQSLPAGVYLLKGEFTSSKGVFHNTLKQVVVK